MDPKRILGEIQNRNHFVFKRLFEETYQELVAYAHGYLFEKSSSEDVVQEIFVNLWENSNKIALRTSLKAYLYAMVRNNCLNRLKAIKITDSSKILALQQATFSQNDAVELFDVEEKEMLYQKGLSIIEKLPSQMRTIVTLRFRENYRYKEIADELNLSINTVKTQLKRAKIKLQELAVCLVLLLLIS